ncbi:DegQ family serine endoprotease [Sediminicurvatus halobius]|uniref:Probable periplasmic serine endoprotease DegP-like n=1 Tax=Sediminicurvatus halobius TaxID=2182432 RepID=A0A2U2N440_9GAMM|nr:DegQ family serine endoprotease [Spiribacter halobius]PWG63759.1 serine peptidase [Spiribacter halobius]UEX76241.1 DegQ family serine endoprotease [Spiribacter halobius]
MTAISATARACLLALLCGLVLPLAASAQLPDFTELVKGSSPAVVNISTTQEVQAGRSLPGMPDLPEDHPFRDFLDRFMEDGEQPPPQFDSRSLGSGFIISEDGYILTNNHVVEGASEIVVRLSDRREMVAELVGADERSDLALLKVDADNLPTVDIGQSSTLEVGEWVLAIGSPFGFEYSVTAGIVSAKGRSLPTENYVPFLQTDVAINPGNSGGPLFNLDGEVVGVNSHIYSRSGGFQGVSFAIPIELAMDVVEQLRSDGRVTRAWLGVLIQDVTRELAESFGMDRPEGALVAQVLPESPAARSGLQAGDVIVQFNGREVPMSGSLPPMVGRMPVGETVTLTVVRDGERRELDVTLEELPEDAGQQPRGEEGGGQQMPPQDSMLDDLGLDVEPLDREARDALGLDDEVAGVVVVDVGPGAAAEAGLQRGDVITRVNREPVTDVAELERVLAALESGQSVPVLVQRQDGPRFLALRVP